MLVITDSQAQAKAFHHAISPSTASFLLLNPSRPHPPSPPPPGGGACLLAHKRHLKAMREQEFRWQPMPEGEWQAYRLFLPLHGSMQHSLCQRGEGPVLVGGDGEMSRGLILCNCLVYGPSGHI